MNSDNIEQHIIDAEHHNHAMGWAGPHTDGLLHYFVDGLSLCQHHQLVPEVGGAYPEDEMFLHTDTTRANCRDCRDKLRFMERWEKTKDLLERV